MKNHLLFLWLSTVLFLYSFEGRTQNQDATLVGELAKQMANPVADLASIPLQNNFEFGIGPHKGFRYSS